MTIYYRHTAIDNIYQMIIGHIFIYLFIYLFLTGFSGDSVVKNLPANEGDAGSIPGSEFFFFLQGHRRPDSPLQSFRRPRHRQDDEEDRPRV